MFLLHFLPDSFIQFLVDCVLIAGAALTVFGITLARWVPYVRNIRKLLTFIGVILLVAGAYWKGGYGVEMEWRAKVAEMQAKVDAAEAKSKQTNTEIKTKIVTKIKKIKEVQYKTKEVIKQREKVINAECKVPKEAIDILNAAAYGKEPGATK